MFGTKCIVLPESGSDFQRSLKMSTLYAEQSFTNLFRWPIPDEAWDGFVDDATKTLADAHEPFKAQLRRVISYIRSIRAVQADMDALVAAGITRYCEWSRLRDEWEQRDESAELKYELGDLIARVRDTNSVEVLFLKHARERYPPYLLDLLPLFVATARHIPTVNERMKEFIPALANHPDGLDNFGAFAISDDGQLILFAIYLANLAETARREGFTIATTSTEYLKALSSAVRLLQPNSDATYSILRETAAANVAETILVRL